MPWKPLPRCISDFYHFHTVTGQPSLVTIQMNKNRRKSSSLYQLISLGISEEKREAATALLAIVPS